MSGANPLSANVTIADLSEPSTLTGDELFESLQTTDGVSTAVKVSLSAIAATATTTFPTIASLQAAKISSSVTGVYVEGYYSPGDGGEALFKRVAANPGVGGVQSSDGAWWKLSEANVTAEMFGAKGDGATNDYTAFANANTYLNARAGGTILVLAKTYILNTALALLPGVTVRGIARDDSILKSGATGVGVIRAHAQARSGYGSVENLTVWGYADRDLTQGDNLAEIGPFDTGRFENVRAIWSQSVSLKINATHCEVTSCFVNFSLRDGIDASPVMDNDVYIHNNHISACGDDAISIHTSTATPTTGYDRKVVISSNVIEKSFGIKCLGVQNAVISNNVLRFYYGYGVYLGMDTVFHQGENTKYNIAVSNNSFTDLLLGSLVGAGATNGTIYITGERAQDGLAAQIEEFNSAAHAFELPEPYMNNIDGAGPTPSNSTVLISDNVSKQTLSGLTKFSDSGYGTLWNSSGSTDPAMTGNLLDGFFVKGDADINGLVVSNNSVDAVGALLFLSGGQVYRDWVITGNVVHRTEHGVVVVPAAGATCGAILITGNSFDIDPYCEAADRVKDGSGDPTGEWSPTDGSNYFGVLIQTNANGVVVTGNTFANCRRPWKSLAVNYMAFENVLYWDWGTTGATNRGIGLISEEIYNYSYFRHSDPRAGTYGLDEPSVLSTTWSTQPSSGYYRAGVFVPNSSPSLATGKVLTGWIRLTSGNAHVTDTDWAAQYVANS